jgi:hypothetical protein
MRRQRPFAARVAVCCCIVLTLVVAGCGSTASAARTIGTPMSTGQPARATAFVRLHAIRTSAFPTNKVSAFDATSTDSGKIAQLFDAIRALKPFPQGVVYNCAMDAGVLYHLTFTRADGSQVPGTAKPDGCESASIGTGRAGQILDWDGFWSLFAATFGVPMSALQPLPSSNGSSGPYAPVSVP